jgi:acetyl/propionyl-CoA carboxylase alpha subunit/acetyl-CoA carboxylase carboxyltransferase component
MKLLVANRGEIAIRIMRAAAELGISTVAVFPKDDALSLHTRRADEARLLAGSGVSAYLDMDQILSVARETGCSMIHPGYGFLSENARFARRCEDEGIQFVGPGPEILDLFGNKAKALALAARLKVPVLPCETQSATLDSAKAFFASLSPGSAMMIKAVAGGGGRGMRAVFSEGEIEEAYLRCRSEAGQAFGIDAVYVEKILPRARHIEVQIVGDGSGCVSHLCERECSIQRSHQKVIEIAPCPTLSAELREKLLLDALALAREVKYKNLGTFEFLVESDPERNFGYAFIEANPRLQVEHTVTEEVMDLDLVKLQIQLASGKTLADLRLLQKDIPNPVGYAIEVRINMETMGPDNQIRPAGGTLRVFEVPSGRGVRTDTCGYVGYPSNPYFDSLLAKLIGHSRSTDFRDAVVRTYRALCEFKIEGVKTNLMFLQNILRHPDFISNHIHTRFVEDHLPLLISTDPGAHPRLFIDPLASTAGQSLAGARVDSVDPLAVLAYGKGDGPSVQTAEFPLISPEIPQWDITGIDHAVVVSALMQGTIVSLDVREGDTIHKDQQVLVMNAMKMEHVIRAPVGGQVIRLGAAPGDTVYEGHPLVLIEERDLDLTQSEQGKDLDLDSLRPDLSEVLERQAVTRDDARPDKVEKRHQRGQRTARENIVDLCDPGTFVEYGSLVIAAQRQRRTLEDLIQNTPTDGLVAGMGRVNGDFFPEEKARCILMSYDYMVLAGTQGMQNHKKKDRMFDLAYKWRLPVVFFTEGGGGRPGDTDAWGVAGLDCMAFHLFSRLSGLVPLVGVNSGRCFAGNAAILGCCDVVIATQNSSIGMGGPAMIEGGGLGVFKPDEVGPISVQVPNGVVDIAVADDAEGVAAARQYLSYFQGPISQWTCADQRLLRHIIPENRLRIYDTRAVIELLADTRSVLELRRHFGLGMVTALIRIEGRPIGVIANNPSHLSGAIDSPAADKASRFMQLCDAYDIPILFLCDTPGIMVGPEVEKTALVRHCCRMFVTGASLTVPYFTIVLRKSYGLGAQAMGGGSHKAPLFVVSWPTGEFGGMGLEGAVKLGYRKEIAAVEDPEERKKLFEHMVAKAYEHGKAINTASHFEIDDVIDPAQSRHVIIRELNAVPSPLPRTQKKRPCIDTW